MAELHATVRRLQSNKCENYHAKINALENRKPLTPSPCGYCTPPVKESGNGMGKNLVVCTLTGCKLSATLRHTHTGADVSIIWFEGSAKLKKPVLKLYATNDSMINTCGTKSLKVFLRTKCIAWWKFLIANIGRPILRVDFLSHYDLLVDTKNKRSKDTSACIRVSCIFNKEQLAVINHKRLIIPQNSQGSSWI